MADDRKLVPLAFQFKSEKQAELFKSIAHSHGRTVEEALDVAVKSFIVHWGEENNVTEVNDER